MLLKNVSLDIPLKYRQAQTGYTYKAPWRAFLK